MRKRCLTECAGGGEWNMIPLPDNSGAPAIRNAELVLKKMRQTRSCKDRLGEKQPRDRNRESSLSVRRCRPPAFDSTASRGSFACAVQPPFVEKIQGLTGEYSRRRHHCRWPRSPQLSDDEPDEAITEEQHLVPLLSGIKVEWSDICSKDAWRRFFHLRAW